MKRWLKWALVALVLVALGLAVFRALSQRAVQREAVARLATQQTQAVIELSATDVVQVRTVALAQGLAISGQVKASNTALVKARVPGELQALSVREGDAVKAGQIIARVDAGEYQARVRQAQEQALAAQAQVAIAQRNFNNNRSLVEQGFISKTALDASAASLAAAQATHEAAGAAAAVAIKSLDDTVLRAPISGWVSQRLAQPGERVGVEARIVEIVDLSRLELEASVSASESLEVRVGQKALLQLEGSNHPIRATVARINPSALAGSRAVMVYLTLENGAGLRQGLFAQGSIGTGHTQVLALPLSAVRTDKPQPYVQVLNGQQVAHQAVQMGARGEFEGQPMVAVQGVAENALVVAGSVGPLRPGTIARLGNAATPAAAGQ